MAERNTREKVYAVWDAIKPSGEKGCHIGPGKPGVGGYCRIRLDGNQHYTHHVALERKLGRPIKPDHGALHTCDNPRCINPDHLREGTPQDNTQDMLERNPEWLANIQQANKRPKTNKQRENSRKLMRQLNKRPRTEKQRAQSRKNGEIARQKLREKRRQELAERAKLVEDWKKTQNDK
jgi:hypothetical protein